MTVWNIFSRMDLAEQRKQVFQEIISSQNFLQKIKAAMNNLPQRLFEEKTHFLALAKIPYSDNEPLHFELLCTIYREITGHTGGVQRYGSHWEVIGFQGTDPATDLRGAGILGLLQLLAFVTFHKKQVQKIFEHSQHEKYNFPFCVAGINMTQIVKEALREGRLDGRIYDVQNVAKVCNDMYFAAFCHLFNTYKEKQYTIDEYPKAQNKVKDMAKKEPLKLIDDFKMKNILFNGY